jgi:hypothetical protein
MRSSSSAAGWGLLGVLVATLTFVGCVEQTSDQEADSTGEASKDSDSSATSQSSDSETVKADQDRKDTRPPPMAQPVPLWKNGKSPKKVDAASARLNGYIVLDLGEEWTPYLFTERGSKDEEKLPNDYRYTYLKLARGKYPDNHHGERARKDKYLEIYGIMPTLSVLRERFRNVAERDCEDAIDLEPLEKFEGNAVYRGNPKARWRVDHYDYLSRKVDEVMQEQGVSSVDQINKDKLHWRDARRIRQYHKFKREVEAVKATQKRLECTGYFEGKGNYIEGGVDWATHEAIAEFERRHRIYSWGYIGNETLEALRQTPMELERRAVVRVLTERAMHAAGVIEDGSTSTLYNDEQRTFTGEDGKEHPVPDMEDKLRKAVVKAFGLETPESALEWLESLGKLPPDEERLVAFPAPEYPEYYDGNMELEAVINRGDVWYEFPYTNEGKERKQPTSRRPKLTIYTKYLDQRIPLARFGTTIGGWRSEVVNGEVMWKYKNSPVGRRVWDRIVAAPVWMPPKSTPAEDLIQEAPGKNYGRNQYEINYHEVGPSYASAYGLVAAYHKKFYRNSDGEIVTAGDEGIRTHGSVDYMSIMRRHSHGCHRLHNHLAVRLMSFVLAHRPHTRVGREEVNYTYEMEHEGYEYTLKIDKGGYEFELEEPVIVRVLEGRVRGSVKEPIATAIPKFNEDAGAFISPDAGPVAVTRRGNMRPIELTPPDAGVLSTEAGVLAQAADGGMPLPQDTTAQADDEGTSTSGDAAQDTALTAQNESDSPETL